MSVKPPNHGACQIDGGILVTIPRHLSGSL